MANITDLLGNIGTGLSIANGVGNLVDGLFGSDGTFGHSSWYKTLKNGEAQNQINQQMAQWNMENVTKPVFQMENEEWQRRFKEQNTEWIRQWNLQNQYNSPEEQLKRYMAIGGNPADFVQGGNGAAAPAATGEVGSPTVNEAASSFANPADLARLQSTEIERKAKNAYAFNMNMQAIKQSIDNITEADFRAKQLEAVGVSVNLGESQIGKTNAERVQIMADMYGWSAKGQNLLAQTKGIQQTISESIQRSKLIEEQRRATALQGDIMVEELNWLPFEKFFGLEETRSSFILNCQRAGESYASARHLYELINTEVKKQALLGEQTEGQRFANDILWWEGKQKGEYTSFIWPKLLNFEGEKLNVDFGLYGKNAKLQYNKGIVDLYLGNGLKVAGMANQYLNTAIDAWATYNSRGMSKSMQPNITIGTPGYNTSPVYQGGTYNPYGQ